MLLLACCARGEEKVDKLTGGHIEIADKVVTHY